MLKENIKIALQSIKSNMLRSIITMIIIVFGIVSLIGTLIAIDAIKYSINSNFTSLGANTFTIRNRESSIRIGRKGKAPRRFRPISYDEAIRFKKEFDFPAKVSVNTMASFNSKLIYKTKKTNPNIQVTGSDENYLSASGYELESGRNFSTSDIFYGGNVALIGQDIKKSLFENYENPLDKFIKVGINRYRIIGLLKEKGSSFTGGGDKIVIIPIQNSRINFPDPKASYNINVVSDNPELMNIAAYEATGLFRQIRKVEIEEDPNFEIIKSDNLANILIDNIKKVTMGATVIGIITLLGAAIALMNIMLVSVTERTREIGIRKALGATRNSIKSQFLTEAIAISTIGGAVGILFGIIIGNVISQYMNIGFYMPWFWTFMGFTICFFVGLISGYFPASRASKLDPIESLRHE
jgi:putative ABC transport system permease protein